MKRFEIQLKNGPALIDEDEVPGLIQLLSALPLTSNRISSASDYISYDEAKALFRELIPEKSRLTRRFGRLWGAIVKAAQFKMMPYDAYCTKCNVQLSEHLTQEVRCSALNASNRTVAISRRSLRDNQHSFLAASLLQVGKGVREDYVYLTDHLPTT